MEGGVTDLNDSTDFVTATCNKSPSSLRFDSKKSLNITFNPFLLLELPDSNSDINSDSDIDTISTPAKVEDFSDIRFNFYIGLLKFSSKNFSFSNFSRPICNMTRIFSVFAFPLCFQILYLPS